MLPDLPTGGHGETIRHSITETGRYIVDTGRRRKHDALDHVMYSTRKLGSVTVRDNRDFEAIFTLLHLWTKPSLSWLLRFLTMTKTTLRFQCDG